jgi:hypothetical protein
MTDVRYSPPAAAVADVPASEPKPRSVVRACQMLVASTLLGFLGLADLPEPPPNAPPWTLLAGGMAVFGLIVALTLWLIMKAYRGRNWARWTLLVLLAPSWIFGALQLLEPVLEAPIQAVVSLVASALDMMACCLLFFAKGARSYFSQARARSGVDGAS